MDLSGEINHIEDPIWCIIEQWKNHPSAVAINEKKLNKQFSFDYIPKSDVKKEILNLNIFKASQDSDVPTKIIKMNTDIFAKLLYNVFNRSLEVVEFPSGMKLTPMHKKGSWYDKGSYWPVSILPNVSKVFERKFLIFLIPNIHLFLSKYPCCFRKGHGVQHCLMALLEKWWESVDWGLEFKVFDCVLHDFVYC